MDHTADTGLVVHAPTLDLIYARAAAGMFLLLTDPRDVLPVQRAEVSVEAADRELLLLRWLTELNLRHILRREVYAEFDVIERTETRLRAAIAGEPIQPGRHLIHTEIKAVTRHGLEIREEARGWRAQVIFDL
jgi:SHS2 domain-containing protein